MVKVIVQGSFGSLELTAEYAEKVKACGHSGAFSIEARTDERLVKFVEAGKNVCTASWQFLEVEEVDTSRLWSIGDYDGAEFIKYLEYEVVHPELNYIEMK